MLSAVRCRRRGTSRFWRRGTSRFRRKSVADEPTKEMGAGIAASPHCAERRICRCSIYLGRAPINRLATPLLDPGSPAQASPSITPFPRERSPTSTRLRCPKVRWSFDVRPVRGEFVSPTLVLRPSSWNPHPRPAKTVRCSAALLGVTALAFRFAHRIPKNPGTASRERQFPLPAPSSRLAPERTRELFPIACRRRSVLLSLPREEAVAPSKRLGRPPRSPEDHAPLPRVAEAKYLVTSLWITGKSGTTDPASPDVA